MAQYKYQETAKNDYRIGGGGGGDVAVYYDAETETVRLRNMWASGKVIEAGFARLYFSTSVAHAISKSLGSEKSTGEHIHILTTFPEELARQNFGSDAYFELRGTFKASRRFDPLVFARCNAIWPNDVLPLIALEWVGNV